MALEASRQLANPQKVLEGLRLKEVVCHTALRVPTSTDGIETHFYVIAPRALLHRGTSSNSQASMVMNGEITVEDLSSRNMKLMLTQLTTALWKLSRMQRLPVGSESLQSNCTNCFTPSALTSGRPFRHFMMSPLTRIEGLYSSLRHRTHDPSRWILESSDRFYYKPYTYWSHFLQSRSIP